MKRADVVKIAWDAVMLVGFGAFLYGLWLVYHPLGFIVGGLLVGAAGLLAGYYKGDFGRRN